MMIKTSNTSFLLGALVLLSAGACGGGDSLSPGIDCDAVIGVPFIVLDPVPPGIQGYQVAEGADIQVTAAVRLVTESEATYDALQGWYCVTKASIPAAATVLFETMNTNVVRLDPGGVIHGLAEGFATITARSTNPVAQTTFGVQVQ